MAIYGINFNGVPIPDGVRRHFAASLDNKFRRVGKDRGCAWLLVGVAQSKKERDAMIVQASNGHRRLHVVTRQTVGGEWFGIYSS